LDQSADDQQHATKDDQVRANAVAAEDGLGKQRQRVVGEVGEQTAGQDQEAEAEQKHACMLARNWPICQEVFVIIRPRVGAGSTLAQTRAATARVVLENEAH
jgi:hypothetical protein